MVALNRLETALTKGDVLPDGGDMEQSFNYNRGNLYTTDEMNILFRDVDPKPDWLESINESALKRMLMFHTLATPTGVCPGVGEGVANDMGYRNKYLRQWTKLYKSPLAESIVDHLIDGGKNKLPVPGFTSMAFPYSGYYAQRDGWAPDSLYLFFKSSRHGRGHDHQDENSIELVAYGRHLLVDGGGVPYTHVRVSDANKIDTYWLVGAMHYYGANTVLVDGACQSSWAADVPKHAYDKPIQARLHSSDCFDFTEGFYRDGYENAYEGPTDGQYAELANIFTDKDKYGDISVQKPFIEKERLVDRKKFKAVHHRQVIFVKPAKFWLVIDAVDRGSSWTQIWKFAPPLPKENAPEVLPVSMPGFTPDQVIIDTKNKTVRTADPKGVNLTIANIHNSTIGYQRYFGNKYPHRGWQNSAGFLPAVQIHTTWSGKAPMLTVLAPRDKGDKADFISGMKTNNTETSSGFEMVTKDQSKIYCRVADKPAYLNCGNIAVTASMLLVLELPDGTRCGMALDAKGMVVNGAGIKVKYPNYEFRLTGNKLVSHSAVEIPTGFKWTSTDRGSVPVYKD